MNTHTHTHFDHSYTKVFDKEEHSTSYRSLGLLYSIKEYFYIWTKMPPWLMNHCHDCAHTQRSDQTLYLQSILVRFQWHRTVCLSVCFSVM